MNREYFINQNTYYTLLPEIRQENVKALREDTKDKSFKDYPGFFSRWFFNNFEDKFVSNFRELLFKGLTQVLSVIIDAPKSKLSLRLTNGFVKLLEDHIEEALTRMRLQLKNIKKISDEDLNNYFYNYMEGYGRSNFYGGSAILKDKAKFSAKILALAFHRPLVTLNIAINKTLDEILEKFLENESEKYKEIIREIDSIKFVSQDQGGSKVIEKKLLSYFEEIFYQIFFLSGKYREANIGSSITNVPVSFLKRIKNFRYSAKSILFKICFTILLPFWVNIYLIITLEKFFEFLKALKETANKNLASLNKEEEISFDNLEDNVYYYLFLQKCLTYVDKEVLGSLNYSVNKAGKYIGKRFIPTFFSTFSNGIKEVFNKRISNIEEELESYFERTLQEYIQDYLENKEALEKNKELVLFILFLILSNKKLSVLREPPYVSGIDRDQINFLFKTGFLVDLEKIKNALHIKLRTIEESIKNIDTLKPGLYDLYNKIKSNLINSNSELITITNIKNFLKQNENKAKSKEFEEAFIYNIFYNLYLDLITTEDKIPTENGKLENFIKEVLPRLKNSTSKKPITNKPTSQPNIKEQPKEDTEKEETKLEKKEIFKPEKPIGKYLDIKEQE